VVVFGLGTGLYIALRPAPGGQFAKCRTTAVAGGSATIGGPFELTDHSGQRVTESDVIDGPTLVYFGYTFCPDVCPLDTYRNAEAVAVLEERGIDVKPVMITIDPERDDTESMAAFAEYMHEDMVGLTGTKEEIKAAIKAYRVYAAKNGEGDNYLMDHSTWTYLMAPDHGFLEFFSRDVTPEDMADQVACFVENL
jgi:protein SCO1/2